MNQSQEVKSPCLKQGSELNDFCLNQTKGQKIEGLEGTPLPKPPPYPLIPSTPAPHMCPTKEWRDLFDWRRKQTLI